MERSIIASLLDTDFYKFTMAQVALERFRNVPVKYAFKNRTKRVALVEFVKEEDLRRELEHVSRLRFTPDELDYLRESEHVKKGVFGEGFLEFLKTLALPPVTLEKEGSGPDGIEYPGQRRDFKIEVSGAWPEAILWETFIPAIVNELYFREVVRRSGKPLGAIWEEGLERLGRKIEILRANPEIKFTDFGTRRRWSRIWHRLVLLELVNQIPRQLLGTSNVMYSKSFNLPPIGTFAHEMFMIFSGIFHDDIRGSHNKVIEMWWQEYGEPLSIALTDTYGTDFFFRDFTGAQARAWRGLRQDSGDPIEFGEKAIKFYERLGIDPRTKVIVFSDGLDVEAIVRISRHFAGRIKVAFGWGTNLTNDLGFDALSLVVKAVEANGHGTVKLSDNLAKAMGKPEDIEMFKKIFGHTVTTSEECKY